MAKLFIFAIGGTGSRVLESLTMLLASGVKVDKDINTIIPIIIDPDKGNGNLAKCVFALEEYQKMYDHNAQKSGFFSTKIENICSKNPFIFELDSVEDKQFKEYIGYSSLDAKNKALINALFTNENLDLSMDVGFKGNPNIGSIVLNQFTSSPTFYEFLNRFAADDRIFIISSIFGGTGAAGFPLLLENIRQAEKNAKGDRAEKGKAVASSVMGAVTYLPYFTLTTPPIPQGDDKSMDGAKAIARIAIESALFVSKSTAALSYYTRAVNDKINALYYVADPYSFSASLQTYGEGSSSQTNKAHFAELLGALAIIDFTKNNYLQTQRTENEYKPTQKKGFDYGLKSDHHGERITFNTLSDKTKNIIAGPLTQFALFSLFLDNSFGSSLSHSWATDGGEESHFTDHFTSSSTVFTDLKCFFEKFKQWLDELKDNRISFYPLNMKASESNLFNTLVTDNDNPRTGIRENIMKETNYIRFNRILNKISLDYKKESAEKRFLPLFYRATKELVKEKYRF